MVYNVYLHVMIVQHWPMNKWNTTHQKSLWKNISNQLEESLCFVFLFFSLFILTIFLHLETIRLVAKNLAIRPKAKVIVAKDNRKHNRNSFMIHMQVIFQKHCHRRLKWTHRWLRRCASMATTIIIKANNTTLFHMYYQTNHIWQCMTVFNLTLQWWWKNNWCNLHTKHCLKSVIRHNSSISSQHIT